MSARDLNCDPGSPLALSRLSVLGNGEVVRPAVLCVLRPGVRGSRSDPEKVADHDRGSATAASIAVLRAPITARPYRLIRTWICPALSGRLGGSPGSRKRAVIVRLPEHGRGCHSRDLSIDQPGKLGWKQYGIVFDREVSIRLVAVETVGRQFDEAGDRQGVEANQCARDPYLEWQFLVVEAPFQLLVAFAVPQEPGGQARSSCRDRELAGQLSGSGPADEGSDRAVQRGVSGEPEIEVSWPTAARSRLFSSSQVRNLMAMRMSARSCVQARVVYRPRAARRRASRTMLHSAKGAMNRFWRGGSGMRMLSSQISRRARFSWRCGRTPVATSISRAWRVVDDLRLDQVVWSALQDVAQRDEGVHAHPLRGLGHQPVHLFTRQRDAALSQQRHQIRGLEHVALGHQVPQAPLVAHLLDHAITSQSSASRFFNAASSSLLRYSFETPCRSPSWRHANGRPAPARIGPDTRTRSSG